MVINGILGFIMLCRRSGSGLCFRNVNFRELKDEDFHMNLFITIYTYVRDGNVSCVGRIANLCVL